VLSVDGTDIAARRSFGISTAFDIATPGVAELRYDTPTNRALLVALQVALWAGAIFIALKIRVPRARRVRSYAVDETLIVLPADGAVPPPAPTVALRGSGDAPVVEVSP